MPAQLMIEGFNKAVAVLERGDPVERIVRANELAEQARMMQSQLADVRRAAVRELRAQGLTLAAIGDQVGITLSRVKQIEAGYGRDK